MWSTAANLLSDGAMKNSNIPTASTTGYCMASTLVTIRTYSLLSDEGVWSVLLTSTVLSPKGDRVRWLVAVASVIFVTINNIAGGGASLSVAMEISTVSQTRRREDGSCGCGPL